MNMSYSRDLKKKVCEMICLNNASTIKTADEYNIPIKTLEKWITAFNKDSHCFDPIIETDINFKNISNINSIDYSDLSKDELKREIMKKDIEIARLKKGYMVKGSGTGRKEFITFSKKNMK